MNVKRCASYSFQFKYHLTNHQPGFTRQNVLPKRMIFDKTKIDTRAVVEKVLQPVNLVDSK